MRIATLFMAVVAAAATAIWLDRSTRSPRPAKLKQPRHKPEHIQEWEGEGGALPLSGAHFSPPIEPAIEPAIEPDPAEPHRPA